MKPYKSRSRKRSGVIGYRLGEQSITVFFEGGKVYRYSYQSAGLQHVDRMVELALNQQGLATYISQHDPGFE